MSARRVSWLLLALVLGVALAVGSTIEGGPPTPADRVERLSTRLRCPTCQGQSVRDSDAPAARALRAEISRRVSQGQTDPQIVDYVVSRYGPDVLLDPPKEGVGLVVWALPAVAVGAAAVGMVVAFRRWRPNRARVARPSAADRALVQEALDP